MARFWIGCSGWNYNHWKGPFYPVDLPARRWFEYYAAHFPTVEINATFYREPSDRTWDGWREAAPEGFVFAVKAHRYLTQMKRLKDPEEPLARVIKGARRLKEHLGPVLYQLPPRFPRNEERAERLEHFLRLLPADLMHVMEFRDRSWWGEDTIAQLRRHGVAFCTHDMGGAEAPLAATAPFVYVRFHGGEQRYAGNYPDLALKAWAERLRGLSRKVREVYVYFNNDIEGYAVENAKTLAGYVGDEAVTLGGSRPAMVG